MSGSFDRFLAACPRANTTTKVIDLLRDFRTRFPDDGLAWSRGQFISRLGAEGFPTSTQDGFQVIVGLCLPPHAKPKAPVIQALSIADIDPKIVASVSYRPGRKSHRWAYRQAEGQLRYGNRSDARAILVHVHRLSSVEANSVLMHAKLTAN